VVAGIAALVAAVIAVPFVLQDPLAFRRTLFAFVGENFSEACLGVAGLAAAIGAGWLVWAAVVMLSPFLENYFYLSLGFAAAAGAVGAHRRV